jgi:uncharacterized protein YndB with AHSA1/START domain
MPDILHKVGIQSASPEAVEKALTTIDGLRGWWTTDTTGDSGVGGVIHFRFGSEDAFFNMKVLELQPARRVLWQVMDGPKEWIGTKVSFDLKAEDGYTIVLFKHEGWKAPTQSMHHCSTKWAIFMMSLKALLETGKGAPFPDDVQIDNWR